MSRYDWNDFNSRLLAHIKANLSCIELVNQEGRPAKRAPRTNDSMWVHCPHPEHEDKNPSCKVYRDGFKCYACQAKGDVFNLVGYFDVTDHFRGQIEGALSRLGLSMEEERARFIASQKAQTLYIPGEVSHQVAPRAHVQRPHHTPESRGITPTTREIWERVLAALTLDEEAARYLEEERGLMRGLCLSVGIRSVQLSQWRALLEEVATDYTLDELQACGLYTVSREHRAAHHVPEREELVCHPCLPSMLVIPYRVKGVLQGLRFRQQDTSYYGGARYLSPCRAQNRGQTPYLADACHLSTFGTSRTLYVHEAELDALSTAQLGRASLGMPGAGSWCKAWGEHWTRYDRVVLCKDDDSEQEHPASQAWAKRIKDDLVALHGEQWVHAHVIETCASETDPSCKDHNALLQQGLLEKHLNDIERI